MSADKIEKSDIERSDLFDKYTLKDSEGNKASIWKADECYYLENNTAWKRDNKDFLTYVSSRYSENAKARFFNYLKNKYNELPLMHLPMPERYGQMKRKYDEMSGPIAAQGIKSSLLKNNNNS
jgi:hypothetical protein